jgi:hypothetical protein
LKAINQNEVKEGERIPNVNVKDLGATDFYPLQVKHSPNGHLMGICNDSEYALFKASSFVNQGFG